MQAVVETATLVGVEAVPVEVQADVGSGLPSFSIVTRRVPTAIRNKAIQNFATLVCQIASSSL